MRLQKLTYSLTIILLVAVLFAVVILSICTGEIKIDIKQIIEILSNKNSIEYDVLLKLRIPRTITALAVGGSLSLCGVILQGIYRNPLVEPFTLGISGGASLGVAIAIVSGLSVLGAYILPLFGFAGAFITIFLVYFLSIRNRRIEINQMLLIGIMLSFISSSIVMFLMSITSAEKINNIVFWTMGSLSNTNIKTALGLLFLSMLSLIIAYIYFTPLNALRLGESKAQHLGINAQVSIRVLFVLTSVLTGCCIAATGVIGFVGLIVPHTARLITSNNYKILLASSFLIGSIFLILCDLLARIIIFPNELPIGVITGILGGLSFLFILHKSKNKSRIG
jgi:ABC-type Fe3+-siderophore transport system, permease component